MLRWNPFIPVIIFLFALSSCGRGSEKKEGLHFTLLPSSGTGVDFTNTIVENDSVNMFVNEYTYMGGGVGIGDFNKDGLPDIFFAGNQVSSRLYINKGNLHFEDITKQAGVGTDSWCTGVSVVDINNDGWPDIYVCVSGKVAGVRRKNLLFINQHDLTFKEAAAAYGLADTSYSTQATFFDFDKDGRLDMYLLNHTLNDNRPNDIRDRTRDSIAVAGDKLFHNEGIPAGMDHPVFKDVSRQAGIIEAGNGLGVVVSDLNGDGYPDIYVANDYLPNDLLWLNDTQGGFTNCIGSSMKHQSYSSMGTDAADINNDGLPDLMTLDMQPETNQRKKMMYSFLSEERRQLEVQKGYEPEYIHNMLQLNNGIRSINNREEPFFSEIGAMAGIAETDWSWSVLIADLDNDGWKDVHITNGLGRDPTNVDFLEYKLNTVRETGIPDNNTAQQRVFREHLDALGPVELRNYIYRNKGDLTFEDVSAQAGINELSISNGAVYVDLDNDGDLDIVTNNINGNAFIMRNDINTGQHADNAPNDKSAQTAPGFLTIILHGDTLNKDGIGAKVYVYGRTRTQIAEQYPVRGYLSSVDNRLHFGFGSDPLDSLKVIWPDGKIQVLPSPPINRIMTLNEQDARTVPVMHKPALPKNSPQGRLFNDITDNINVLFKHKETFYYDYAFQPLIQQKYSQEGPFICTGDLNGDGLQDFFIGGAFRQSGKVFLQQPNGSFSGKDLVAGVKNEEDLDCAVFDANGDGYPDILVVGGSTEFEPNSQYCRPRLYLNDGKGNFSLDNTAFPPDLRTPGKSLAVADMDGDGDPDVFIGGRISLGLFPQPPRSYLLRNDRGKFTDVTDAVCPALKNPGLLNAAVWTDVDKDNKPDLILAGDWMPIRIFKNNGSTLTEITGSCGLKDLPGFWRSLAVTDINHDGYPDIIAGNLGSNNSFHISAEQPARLVAKDFDGNGIVEPIFCYYIKDNEGKYQLSSGISRDLWVKQMPVIKKTFDNNESYAKAPMETIFPKEMMEGATVLDCKEVRSGYFENDGKGAFHFHPFCAMAQIAPVNAIVCTDINGDGIDDIILGGNEYQASVATGRYDASYGLLLTGNRKEGFDPVLPVSSGLIMDGDVKDLVIIKTATGKVLLSAINDEKMKAYSIPR